MKRKRYWRKSKKPLLDLIRPLAEQHANDAVVQQVDGLEVIISREEIKKITHIWLYESNNKQHLMWLMLLYSNPDIAKLTQKLNITKDELLVALENLRLGEKNEFKGN